MKLSILLFAIGILSLPAYAASTNNRAYSQGKYGLELDNVKSGLVDADGGNAVADVITEKMGGDHLAKKHIGGVKYEDINIAVSTGGNQGLFQWIQETLDRKFSRKSGSIVATDRANDTAVTEFKNALITEIGMPALDAGSKDAAKMTVKFKPEYSRRTFGSGKGGGGGGGFGGAGFGGLEWQTGAFRLKVTGLEGASSRVNKIDSFTIKQSIATDEVGEAREYQKEPSKVEIPNLSFYLPEGDAQPFYDWHEDFVIKGNNGDDKERGGTLEYLTPDLKTVLFTLTFKNLGIFKVAPDKSEAGSEQLKRVKAEMYCEDIRFTYSSAATFAKNENVKGKKTPSRGIASEKPKPAGK